MNSDPAFWASFHKERRRKHAKGFLQLTEEKGSGDVTRLESEVPNIVKAMKWSLDAKDYSTALAFAEGVCDPIYGLLGRVGLWDRAQDHLEGVLALTRQNNDLYADALRQQVKAMPSEGSVIPYTDVALSMLLFHLSAVLINKGEFTAARHYLEQLTNEPKKEKSILQQTYKAQALNNLGIVALNENDLELARILFDRSLALARRLNLNRDVGVALYQLGRLAESKGELRDALNYFTESLEYAGNGVAETGFVEQGERVRRLANINNGLGTVSLQLKDYDAADKYLHESLRLKQQLGEKLIIASTLHNLAVLERARGNLAQAYQLCMEALDIYDRLGSDEADSVRRLLGIMRRQFVEGKKALAIGDYRTAEVLFLQSLEFYTAAADHQKIATVATELGDLYKARDDLTQAETYYQLAVGTDRAHNSPGDLSASLHQLGYLRIEQNRILEAIELFSESMEIDRELGDDRGVAVSQVGIGQLLWQQGQKTEAISMLRSARSTLVEVGETKLGDSVRNLVDTYTSRSQV